MTNDCCRGRWSSIVLPIQLTVSAIVSSRYKVPLQVEVCYCCSWLLSLHRCSYFIAMDYCPDARCRETEVSEFLLDNTQEGPLPSSLNLYIPILRIHPLRGAQTPCPQLHFAPRLRAKWESEWSLARPAALHDDEWVPGPFCYSACKPSCSP